jgi:hypothetical protein
MKIDEALLPALQFSKKMVDARKRNNHVPLKVDASSEQNELDRLTVAGIEAGSKRLSKLIKFKIKNAK